MIRLQRHNIPRPSNVHLTIRTTLDFMAWCNRNGYITHTGNALKLIRGTFYVDVPDEAAAVEMAMIWSEHYTFEKMP